MEKTDLSGMGIDQSSRPGVKPAQQQAAQKFDATNVNDQLNSTLNSNSLLMRVARSNGQATAAQRGLGNSSIGAESAQRAMVDAALPIAQQNAQQSNQTVMQDKDLNWKSQQSQLDRTHQSSMQDKDLNWKGQQSQLDRNQELSVLDKQGAIDKDKLAQQVVANTHGMYMSSIDSAVNSYNDRYAALVADKTMSAADKTNLINSMKAELNSTLKMYQQLYSNVSTIRPDWSQFPTIQLPGVSLG
ncbi:hypothetical protein ABKY47_002990 [Aeromonas hydrophila]